MLQRIVPNNFHELHYHHYQRLYMLVNMKSGDFRAYWMVGTLDMLVNRESGDSRAYWMVGTLDMMVNRESFVFELNRVSHLVFRIRN